eukprot:757377-Hanusia_phi.AAC.4
MAQAMSHGRRTMLEKRRVRMRQNWSLSPPRVLLLVCLQQTTYFSHYAEGFVGSKVSSGVFWGKEGRVACRLVESHQSLTTRRRQRCVVSCKISDEDRRRLEDSFRVEIQDGTAMLKDGSNEFVVQGSDNSVEHVFDEIWNLPVLTENRQSSVDRSERAPCVLFPGMKQILLIELPNECHMFETLIALPHPHLFGYLPLASNSFRRPSSARAEDELSFGNLMEVVSWTMEVSSSLSWPSQGSKHCERDQRYPTVRSEEKEEEEEGGGRRDVH